MDESKFLLGAFVYPKRSPNPWCSLKPVIVQVQAKTLHLARRMLAVDMLQRDYFLLDIRKLPNDFLQKDEGDEEEP